MDNESQCNLASSAILLPQVVKWLSPQSPNSKSTCGATVRKSWWGQKFWDKKSLEQSHRRWAVQPAELSLPPGASSWTMWKGKTLTRLQRAEHFLRFELISFPSRMLSCTSHARLVARAFLLRGFWKTTCAAMSTIIKWVCNWYFILNLYHMSVPCVWYDLSNPLHAGDAHTLSAHYRETLLLPGCHSI